MKKMSLFPSLWLTLCIVCFSACQKSNDPDPQPPSELSITSVTPTSGPYNSLDTIIGTGFGATAAQNKVFFNGKSAEIVSATDHQLVVRVPLGAGTGDVTVQVNGNTATGARFSYILSTLVTTIAGYGSAGTVDGPGNLATFAMPTGVTTDANGNIYVADGACTIRKITPNRMVSTFAGTPSTQGTTDGIGSAALFRHPYAVATDINGTVFVADADGPVRKISPQAQVTTFVNNAIQPTGIAVDAAGNVYTTSPFTSVITKFSPSGVKSTLAGHVQYDGSGDGTGEQARFDEPWGVAVDVQGNVYVTDIVNQNIRKITPGGVVTTVAGGLSAGSTDGPAATAKFNKPRGVAVDHAGNIYVADQGNNSIRKITPEGIVSTMVSNISAYTQDGTGFYKGPFGICVDKEGRVYVTNTGESKIIRISEE